MASSEDESDYVVESVSNYEFLDERDEPVSFSLLPIQWDESNIITNDDRKLQIFLKGNADNGLQTVLKQVIRWKFDLEKATPEISVLTKEKNWIKLVKPRKAFGEKIIRSVLITIHCLHFARRNVDVSDKSVWEYLSRVFNTFDVRPSQNDLVDHIAIIAEAVERDDLLKSSKYILAFLEEKPRKRMDESVQATKMSDFIIDDADDYESEDGDEESDDDDDLFDPVCVFCDNGGDLLCCEGECLRSFHATKEAGDESYCESLLMTDKEVEEMSQYVCENCKYKKHQCFACGRLGSSDKSSSAEVFRCINATCGHFYHPRCVANLLHRNNEVAAKELQEKIAAGEKFACPIHKCSICNQPENKKEVDFQFALCRRCPTSYHRKCLPREIAFEDIEEENIITRAWEGLLPNRVLIYCLKHEIDAEIGTPVRDHVKFPFRKEEMSLTEMNRKKRMAEFDESKEKVLAKKRRRTSENSFARRTIEKPPKGMSSAAKKNEISRKVEKLPSTPNLVRKFRANGESTKSTRDNAMSSLGIDGTAAATVNMPSLGERLYSLIQSGIQGTSSSKLKPLTVKTTAQHFTGETVQLDSDSEKRILSLMQEAASSITMKDVVNKHKIPSTHTSSLKAVVDKTITLGKVEGTVEAVRTALQKLQDGCSSDDAKAVCEPEVLSQIFKWKNKLKVYLAPFLYSMRYTSFGRHFTKEEKLKQIVDMLHCYVQNGDMVVDFCCGANDFSCLMKKKLEETGKKCFYKNYDIVQPKNDFNFEKRDWMTVKPKELQKEGSQLIMGLNPPFGVKASLANRFIDKALEFKPKLLILIVPPETERLDKKNPPYDLVWEDYQFLSGKSFYLPGSVDINDKQMEQWNNTPPVIYLWSHRDWSAKHKAIAEKHGHGSIGGTSILGNDSSGIEYLQSHDDTATSTSDRPKQNKQQEEKFSRQIIMAEGCHEGPLATGSDVESQGSRGPRRSRSGEITRNDGEKIIGDVGRKSPKARQNSGNKVSNKHEGIACHSSANVADDRLLQEGRGSRGLERSRSGESRRNDGEQIGRDLGRKSLKGRQSGENIVSLTKQEITCHSSSNIVDEQFLQEDHPSSFPEMPPHREGENYLRQGKMADGKDVGRKSPKERQNSGNSVSNTRQGITCHSSPNVVDHFLREGHISSFFEMPLHQDGENHPRKEKTRVGKSTEQRQYGGPMVNNANECVTSHSPPHVVDDRFLQEGFPSTYFEMPSRQDVLLDGCQNLDPGITSSLGPYGAPYGTSHASSHGNSGMYNLDSEPVPQQFSNVGNKESHYAGQLREVAGSNSYGSCVPGLNREMDLQSRVRLYGQDPGPYGQGNVVEHNPGYGHSGSLSYTGSAMDSPYMVNMSATQRYAPRLDELNRVRMNDFDPAPLLYNANGMYDARAPFYMDPLHFPPGPFNHF